MARKQDPAPSAQLASQQEPWHCWDFVVSVDQQGLGNFLNMSEGNVHIAFFYSERFSPGLDSALCDSANDMAPKSIQPAASERFCRCVRFREIWADGWNPNVGADSDPRATELTHFSQVRMQSYNESLIIVIDPAPHCQVFDALKLELCQNREKTIRRKKISPCENPMNLDTCN